MAGEWVRATAVWDASGTVASHTTTNWMNMITSLLTQCGWAVPSWDSGTLTRYFIRSDWATSDVWTYTGDGATQRCGLYVTVTSSLVTIYTFVENSAKTAVAYTQNVLPLTITVDTTAPNNFTWIAGEHGLYVEAGRDGLPVNLGHGFVGTHLPIDELYDPRAAYRKWSSQGFCVPLQGIFGTNNALAISRSAAMTSKDGIGHVYTSSLQPYLTRCPANLNANVQSSNGRGYLGNRAAWYGSASRTTSAGFNYGCYFGIPYSPIDGRYTISPLLIIPTSDDPMDYSGISDAVSITGVTANNYAYPSVRDYRRDRQVKRFAVVDYTVLPFANIQDTVTSLTYRVAQIYDNGRTCNIAVEWPSTAVTLTL